MHMMDSAVDGTWDFVSWQDADIVLTATSGEIRWGDDFMVSPAMFYLVSMKVIHQDWSDSDISE